ncbi:metallophosphoesterase [Desulfovibrio fairfieldensis]|uniref:metallophosphoesterase n=1 Tax=Desulfovibrio fairfieldensis TaxID=44742 RepID=UPI0009FA8E59|nr:metallophosphoesterase [Desulfovibrio fairfieldensis]
MEEKSILVLGDSHARWDYLCSILAFYSPDLCIVAGDFGWWPKLFPLPHDILPASVLAATELHFLDGNHEDHPSLCAAAPRGSFQSVELAPHVIYHPRGSTMELPDGRTVFFAGGGKSIDRAYREEGRDWFPEEILERAHLPSKLPKVDIVLSHTVPAAFGIAKHSWKNAPRGNFDFSPDPSVKVLDMVLRGCRPSLWISAHYHRRLDGIYAENGMRTEYHILDQLDGYFCSSAYSSAAFWLSGRPCRDSIGFGFPDGSIAEARRDASGLYGCLPHENIPLQYRGAAEEFFRGRTAPVLQGADGKQICGAYFHDVGDFLRALWKRKWT